MSLRGANYEVMANDDDYDPRKPEYITPATQDQMEQTSSELLGKQIAHLEDLLERRQEETQWKSSKAFQHYEQVLAEMRYKAGRCGGRSSRTHCRMRSDPSKQPDQAVHSDAPRTFAHARIRSAPGAVSSCDIVPSDDKPLHVNRVHESRPLHSPAEQISESARGFTCGPLPGPTARVSGCLSPKLASNPVKGMHRALPRGPSPSPHMYPGEQLRPAPSLSQKTASVHPPRGTIARKRPATPPSAKTMGPRRSQVQNANFMGLLTPLCGDLVDESPHEFVVSSLGRPTVGGRQPGVAHLLQL